MARVITMADARKKAADLIAEHLRRTVGRAVRAMAASTDLDGFDLKDDSVDRVALGVRWVQDKLLAIAGDACPKSKLPATFHYWREGARPVRLVRMVRR